RDMQQYINTDTFPLITLMTWTPPLTITLDDVPNSFIGQCVKKNRKATEDEIINAYLEQQDLGFSAEETVAVQNAFNRDLNVWKVVPLFPATPRLTITKDLEDVDEGQLLGQSLAKYVAYLYACIEHLTKCDVLPDAFLKQQDRQFWLGIKNQMAELQEWIHIASKDMAGCETEFVSN
ncbi:5543_t:CDS:2, partial [Paraglomus brasilianum]